MISGAFHYQRVHPGQWRERLALVHAMGCDTVETYVPWNLHEPREGEFVFDGLADLGHFLDLTAEAGLKAIVRPGPYICAEWENGGLPAWLTGRPGMRIRTAEPAFLAAVDAWFDVLVPLVAERQVTRGGNVTMVQVENEYGSFGDDSAYLEHLADGLRRRGIDVPLFTSDGPADYLLAGGTLPEVRATVNFGSKPAEAFETLARHRPEDEPFCMEFWNGWFDHWGEAHHTRDAADAARVLDEMLGAGASVNFYMAHGGTNFGCTAGANQTAPDADHPHGQYLPTITSYDYDAPIDEAGRPTAKFWAYREVIGRYTDLPAAPVVPERLVLPAGEVAVTEELSLAAHLDTVATISRSNPPTYEELGLTHGLVRYRTHVRGPREPLPLSLPGLGDRAHVYADGELLGIVDRAFPGEPLQLQVPADGCDLEIWVESMGRVNYGPQQGDRKGLVGGVQHGQPFLHGWEVATMPLPGLPTDLGGWQPVGEAGPGRPTLYRGSFDVARPADGFLALDDWRKGYVWVNGFCLGRYWSVGPQRTLYLPGPVVVEGRNEIVVLELDGCDRPVVAFEERADLGAPTTNPLV
ncbi:beta-galactosidase [Isoptericola hypogeus]|uniref:Beta-galactosidase n=1 Tax=Isoptericola hypogeus TaxID=300179 RepID=A0ABN2JJ00_9MICO